MMSDKESARNKIESAQGSVELSSVYQDRDMITYKFAINWEGDTCYLHASISNALPVDIAKYTIYKALSHMNCHTIFSHKIAHKRVPIKVGKGDYINAYVDIEPPTAFTYEAIWRAKDMLRRQWMELAKKEEGIVK